jgi:hypothetical protein
LTDTEVRQSPKIATDGVLRSPKFPSHFGGEDTFSQGESLANDAMTFVREKVERRHCESKHV